MMNNLLKSASRTFYKVGFKAKEYSPELLVGAGIITGIAGAVAACKATTKVDDILSETKEQVDKVHAVLENEEYADRYTEEDSKKDLLIIYTKAGVKMAKLYAPAIGLGLVSISCILASTNIMKKRNVALAAAYTALDKGFKEYRGRVIDRFGERVDYELKNNIRAEEIEVTEVDENGNEVTKKELVDVCAGLPDEYSRFFDETCKFYEKNAEMNKLFIIQKEEYANKLLECKGHLFLNDVYELLGFEPTKIGQIMGWVWDEDYANGEKRIDFGIFDIHDETKRLFVNGYEKSILLNFNIDGNVYKTLA